MDAKPAKRFPYEPYSERWEREADMKARAFSPGIKPCQHCNAPVLYGFCCDHCGSETP